MSLLVPPLVLGISPTRLGTGDLLGDGKRRAGPCQGKRRVPLAAWAVRDLVLAGITEVTFGAMPVHPGSGLPTDHSPEDGMFPCGRKRQAGSLMRWGRWTGSLTEVLTYVLSTSLGT